MATTTQQLTKSIETILPILNDNIKDGIDGYNNYLECLKDEKFEEKPNEREEDAIKRAESIYDRLDEMIKKNELSNKKALETIEILKKMTDLFNKIVRNTNVGKEKLAVRNNELIHTIIDLEKRKTTKLIEQDTPRENELNEKIWRKKKGEWKKNIVITEKMKKQIEKEKEERYNLNKEEWTQIEEWTKMKFGNVIFDSDVDDWIKRNSVFDQKILNKSNLLFLIEDNGGYKFGGYVSVKIDQCDIWIKDSKSFVFPKKKYGEIDETGGFNRQDSFKLFNKNDGRLFAFRNRKMKKEFSFYVLKERSINLSFCEQKFEGIYLPIELIPYSTISNKTEFTPKRITVIQLN